MDYKTIRSLQHAEANDCAVVAVTIATGISYNDVHDLFSRMGRKNGQGAPRYVTTAALGLLGFALQEIAVEGQTVKTVSRRLRNGTYLVRTQGHISAIKNGKIEDCIETIGNNKVKNVYRVRPMKNTISNKEDVISKVRAAVARDT